MISNLRRNWLYQIIFAAMLAAVSPAYAFVAFFGTVTDNVTTVGPNVWHYDYGVTAGCFGNCSDTLHGIPVTDGMKISDFYVPYFAGAGISGLSAPTDWTVAIENVDLFSLGHGAEVIHWWTAPATAIAVGNTLSGFSYDASYSGAKAPFQVVNINGGVDLGDPLIPASPQAIAAGLQPVATVPEPTSYALIFIGLLGLGLFRQSRRHSRKS